MHWFSMVSLKGEEQRIREGREDERVERVEEMSTEMGEEGDT